MKELLLKYKNNTITHSELLRLREMMDNLSDDELSALMLEDWMEGEETSCQITEDDIRRIKESIDAEREDKSSVGLLLLNTRRILLRVAAVLLPLFVFTTLYYYRENSEMGQSMVSVVTGEGEKTSVILPDGTRVIINSSSKLSYCVADFTDDVRNVNFSGEAFFDVKKNPAAPFVVSGSDFSVRVLGTKFNVNAYYNSQNVIVSLEEGFVRFDAGAKENSVVMKPNEMTIYDRSTGKLTTTNMIKTSQNSSWCRNEMVFFRADLDQLINALQKSYGMHVDVDLQKIPDDTFTGVLPSNNLAEALDIIEELYGVKASVTGRHIIINRK